MTSKFHRIMAATLAAALLSFAGAGAAEEPKQGEAAQKPTGRAAFEQEVVDTGQVVRGQTASATFVIKNVGADTLKVLSAKPSCGCTVASFDATIPPGGSGKVMASVKTEHFRGPIAKAVTVTTDDPVRPVVELQIQANVVGSVNVLPRAGLALPTAPEGDYVAKILLRKDETEKGDLAVTDVVSSVPWLMARARKVRAVEPAAGDLPEALPGDYVLEVSVGDDAPKSQAAHTVTFKTGLPREPEVTVPISVSLLNPLRLQPWRLYLEPASSRDEASASLSAVVRPGLGNETLKATISPEPFTVKIEPDGERRYKATVTWKPSADASPGTRPSGSRSAASP